MPTLLKRASFFEMIYYGRNLIFALKAKKNPIVRETLFSMFNQMDVLYKSPVFTNHLQVRHDMFSSSFMPSPTETTSDRYNNRDLFPVKGDYRYQVRLHILASAFINRIAHWIERLENIELFEISNALIDVYNQFVDINQSGNLVIVDKLFSAISKEQYMEIEKFPVAPVSPVPFVVPIVSVAPVAPVAPIEAFESNSQQDVSLAGLGVRSVAKFRANLGIPQQTVTPGTLSSTNVRDFVILLLDEMEYQEKKLSYDDFSKTIRIMFPFITTVVNDLKLIYRERSTIHSAITNGSFDCSKYFITSKKHGDKKVLATNNNHRLNVLVSCILNRMKHLDAMFSGVFPDIFCGVKSAGYFEHIPGYPYKFVLSTDVFKAIRPLCFYQIPTPPLHSDQTTTVNVV